MNGAPVYLDDDDWRLTEDDVAAVRDVFDEEVIVDDFVGVMLNPAGKIDLVHTAIENGESFIYRRELDYEQAVILKELLKAVTE